MGEPCKEYLMRIWLQPPCYSESCEGRMWCEEEMDECSECGAKCTLFIRADMVTASEEPRQ